MYGPGPTIAYSEGTGESHEAGGTWVSGAGRQVGSVLKKTCGGGQGS